jgi:hypothetical protein
VNNNRRSIADQSSIEGRLAARLAGAITLSSQSLPHDISERLRFSREQAVARARSSRQQAVAGVTALAVSRSGVATLGRFAPWWQKMASVLPLVVLVSGMLMIDRWNAREQVLVAAEIDTQLLSDTLPPAAYSDPGFAEFLKSNPTP